ncbi:MAG: hypothetical protein ACYDH1_15730 [Anaerolineaceae bacterium]
MNRFDRVAISLCVIMVFISAWISNNIYENMPHIEDEIAYVWQANLVARGDLYIQSPPCPKCFLVPFVIDLNGIRFGKYPPGWPAILGIGVRIGIRDWINPIFAGFNLWLIYLLVKKVTNEKAGLIAAGLTITSPFFLLNSGTLLSHIWSLWLSLVFIHAWIDIFYSPHNKKVPAWILVLSAGLSLGLLALTRPLTAVGIALPFIIHGTIILIKGSKERRIHAISIAVLGGLIASLIFVWQAGVTGNPLLNPYQLWWPYDQLGFGPDVGLQPGGFSLVYAKMNTKFSLRIGYADLFGWFKLSWIFIPIGIFTLWKNWKSWLILSIFPSLVMAYTFYWIGSWLFGPRYFFEGITGLILFSAVGIQTLAGKFYPMKRLIHNWRWTVVTALVVFLVSANLFFYLPQRLGNMRGLYGATSARLTQFKLQTSQKLTPALIIVHKQEHWIEYGTLLELSSPYLDSPWIMTYSRGPDLDKFVSESFPNRTSWHYYPDEPYRLYSSEKQ